MSIFSKAFKDFLHKESRGVQEIYKGQSGTQALLAYQAFVQGRDCVVLLPEQNSLEEFASLLQLFLGEQQERPSWERDLVQFPAYLPQAQGRQDWALRWASLFSLLQGKSPKIILITADNLLPYWPGKERGNQEYLFLMQGAEFPPQEILDKAVNWGYERVSMVTSPGEISMRGDIVDIYNGGYHLPLRLEFFGDYLESIRLFEPVSQRSRQNLDEVILLPASGIIQEKEYWQRAEQYWEHLWKTGLIGKSTRNSLPDLIGKKDVVWPGFYYPDKVALSEWLPETAVYLLAAAGEIRSRLEDVHGRWQRYLSSLGREKDFDCPRDIMVQKVSSARQTWLNKTQVIFEDLPLGQRKTGIAMPEKRYASFEELVWHPELRRRPWSLLLQKLQEWQKTKNQIILAFNSLHSRDKFLKLFQDSEIRIKTEYARTEKGIFALISSITEGLELQWNHLLILSERVLHPYKDATLKRAKARGEFKGLTDFEGLEPQELLVHRDYGLGCFQGLVRLQANGVGNDYLQIVYADQDKLYVPVDRLNLVQKYKGPEGATPALDKLGSNAWKNTKSRIRKSLQAIAHDLVQMYAYRKVAKGYAYGPLDDLYHEFETTFDFDETPDQDQVIQDVLQDMEKSQPMDRLVCGDVGFGKTEVAMRAAFRAVISGKQVALLCPTTVLAEQHYVNFQERMHDFGVNVQMISRFISRAEQKKILQAVENGRVDILIGTHRLLSQDVHLPSLGLFILDEEQRFGVRQKERIKELRQNVDVLTLTATPIPRTLQLSLSGIRQLSIIETPPQDRKAVETSIVDRERKQLRGILQRELQRSGQVFWVYNRVKDILRVEEYVRSLVPEAKVAVAHGQMSEKKLEETMHAFWQKELDVLVCTAIIESGLDFPNANTLIVDQAHMFGLSQLYQLRGRVGRSREQAFAYFVIPSLDALSGKARKRLQTILDMDYLGAGFQVAREDLRLRGAGNILGESQTGNIGKVGLDLFLEMLQQEIGKIRGDPVRQATDPELNIKFAAHIPEDYISGVQERLYYYKLLSAASDPGKLDELQEEIIDRFGPLPEALHNLLAVLQLKCRLSLLCVHNADIFSNRILMHWADNAQPFEPQELLSWMQKHSDHIRYHPQNKLELQFRNKGSISEAIRSVCGEIEELLPAAKAEKQFAEQ